MIISTSFKGLCFSLLEKPIFHRRKILEKPNILHIEIKSGKDQTIFRAIPKLVDPNGNYKIPFGFVFGNKNIVKKENNLVTLPIYLIMFL